jgi:hypothetical protein
MEGTLPAQERVRQVPEHARTCRKELSPF